MRINIDENKCIGCGLCDDLLPGVFTVGEYRTFVRRARLRVEEEEQAREAAEDCPVRAIFFTEDE